MRKCILFFSIFCLLSCKKDVLLVSKKTVTFSNGLGKNYRFFGTFKEKDSTFVFFADLVSKKKIYFHTPTGKLVDSIALHIKEKVLALNFISRDTFFVSEKPYITALNRKGEVLKQVAVNNLLEKEDSWYHFKPSVFMQSNTLKNRIPLGLDWRGYKERSFKKADWWKHNYSQPNLLYINHFFFR